MKSSAVEKIILWSISIIFGIYAFTLIFPFVWMLLNSLKTNTEFLFDVWSLPERWLFKTYIDALQFTYKGASTIDMFLNSIIYVVFNVAINITVNVTGAYVLAKFRFKGNAFLNSLILILMVVPLTGSTVTVYRFMKEINLYNTFLGLILITTGGFGVGYMMLFAFFKNLSSTYMEAAQIDGANEWVVLLRVIVPLAIPIVLPVMILMIINTWNDFFTPYLYLPKHPTIAVGLNELNINIRYIGNYPLLFAVMILSVLPILIVYIIFQDAMLNVTLGGGIKE